MAALSFRGHVRNRTIVEAKKQQLLDIMKVCVCGFFESVLWVWVAKQPRHGWMQRGNSVCILQEPTLMHSPLLSTQGEALWATLLNQYHPPCTLLLN